MKDLRARTLSGLKWTGAAQAARQLLQFAVSVFLARMLSPNEFGLMGMILVFTGAAAMFRELGLGTALVQKKNLEERHLNAIFWASLASGAALTAAFAAGAGLVAAFYGQPVLRALTAAVGLNFVMASLTVVQRNMLVRAMDFRRLFMIDLAGTACSGLAAAAAAWWGFGVWSLIAQSMVLTGASGLLMWLMSPWRPSLTFDFEALRELFGYSANLLGYNLLDFSNRNLDNLLVGRYFGPGSLGVYARAYDLMLLPISQITSILERVMFPAMSSIQHDVVLVKRVYMRATRTIALVTFPMMTGLLLTAGPFVSLVYGRKWLEVVPIIRIFCLVGMIDSITTTTGWIFISQGRTDIRLRWGLYSFVVTTLCFLAGLPWGVKGIAWGYVACFAVQLYPCWTVAGRLIGLSFGEMASNLARTFFCAMGMGAAVWLMGLFLPPHWPSWAYLAAQVPAGVLIYVGLIHFFQVPAYAEVREILAEQLRLRRAGPAPAGSV